MRKQRIAAALLTAAVITGAALTATAAQGDKDDPLVTVSYLEKVFTAQMEKRVDEAVARNEEELKKQLDIAVTSYENRVDETLAAAGGVVFETRELAKGGKFTTAAGHEILLVSGTANAVGQLTDTTAGAVAERGAALTAGHLYVTVNADSGLQATSGARIMVR